MESIQVDDTVQVIEPNPGDEYLLGKVGMVTTIMDVVENSKERRLYFVTFKDGSNVEFEVAQLRRLK